MAATKVSKLHIYGFWLYNLYHSVCRMIRGLGTVNIVQVACGFKHSLVLTDGGKLFSFGDNEFGQLGLGPSAGERVLTPQPMECLEGMSLIAEYRRVLQTLVDYYDLRKMSNEVTYESSKKPLEDPAYISSSQIRHVPSSII